jgi:UPF0716 family protein affecting phage T7 exclusion
MERSHSSALSRELWVAVGAGPIIWAVHFGIMYVAVALYCSWRFFSATLIGLPLILWLIIAVTVAGALLVFYAGYLAYRNLQRLHQAEAEGVETEDHHWFLARSGIALTILFNFVLVVTAVPAFFEQICW